MDTNKRTDSRRLHRIMYAIAVSGLLWNGQGIAGSMLNSCYDLPAVTAPAVESNKALYVFIDQTMELTMPMKTALIDLVSQWGNNGEIVKITRFSANIKGQFTELVFDETGNIKPTEPYLFHLRSKHKKSILACIEKHKNDFHDKLVNSLTNTLKMTDDKLPKTNLLHSLNDFAEQLISDKSVRDKTVLLVSDGLENSDLFSFHQRNKIRLINPKQMLGKARSKKLIPNWHGAKVYFLGLGYISDEKFYSRPKIIQPLKTFWSTYFAEGNAELNPRSIGTPMLLTSSIL